MPRLLRSLQLLAISLWVGGIVFFAFVLAPVAFHTLPTAHEAGTIVKASLTALHRIGIISAAIFLVAALFTRRRRSLLVQALLVTLMLAATLFSDLRIIPAMDQDRASGEIDQLAPSDPHRLHFNHLHALSEQLEGAVLFLGLAVIVLIACEPVVTEP